MPARSMTKGGIEGVGCLHAAVSGEGEICSNGGGKSFAYKDKEMIIESNGSTKKRPSTRNFHCSDGSSSSSSSSIGKNSDLSEESGEKQVGDEEVQSSYKGPLDAMEALEQVLPIRRGISRFYNGKSKSFASLADASPSSSSLAKPENAYMRKRRNLLACSLAYDHPRTRGNNGGGISKRAANGGNKTNLALAVAMTKASEQDKQPLTMASPSSMKDFSSWRSFSMVDLQQN